jgi:hypothetical protein
MTAIEFLKRAKVMSDEECANADYRVCSGNRNMAGLNDDLCSNCGCVIYYDPRVPVGPKQKLACLFCLGEIVRDNEEDK